MRQQRPSSFHSLGGRTRDQGRDMIFDLVFISLFVAGWLLCGYLPWAVKSVVTRGNAGLKYLPLCLFAAVVCGLAVPIIGFTGVGGLVASFAVAALAPAILLAVSPTQRPGQ
jgi:hypothetical protein